MIPVTQLRAGKTFRMDGELFQVLIYKHTKMGRWNASIRIKARNLVTGAIFEKTFVSGAKVEPVETITRPLQYLYQDGGDFYFMDPKSFEQFSLPGSIFEGKEKFLKEGREVKILFADDQPLSFELPNTMVFEVIESSPGIKGDTVAGATKSATLDNDLTVRVPLFIKKGDKIKVDTRTGEYLERLKEDHH